MTWKQMTSTPDLQIGNTYYLRVRPMDLDGNYLLPQSITNPVFRVAGTQAVYPHTIDGEYFCLVLPSSELEGVYNMTLTGKVGNDDYAYGWKSLWRRVKYSNEINYGTYITDCVIVGVSDNELEELKRAATEALVSYQQAKASADAAKEVYVNKTIALDGVASEKSLREKTETILQAIGSIQIDIPADITRKPDLTPLAHKSDLSPLAKDSTVAKEVAATANKEAILAAIAQITSGLTTEDKAWLLQQFAAITIDTSTLATKTAQTAQTGQLTTLQQRLAVSSAYTAQAITDAEATAKAQDHIRAVQGAVTGDTSAATNYQSHALVRIKQSATDTDNASELASLDRNMVYGGQTTSKSWQQGGQTITAQGFKDTGYGFTEFWLKNGNNWIHYTSSLPSAQDNINTLHPALHTTTTDAQGNITRTPSHIISLTNPN